MTCTKTGAHIWIEPYNEFAYGDAFEVGPFKTKDAKVIEMMNRLINKEPTLNTFVTNIAYFKLVRRSFSPINGLGVKHYTVHDFAEILGEHEAVESNYWPPIMLITNNFTNHGTTGVPLT